MPFRKGSITIVVTLLFLAFAGQTLAMVGMPCSMAGDMPDQMGDLAQDDAVSDDQMADCHTSTPSGADLCQQESPCFTNSCAPAAILPSLYNAAEWHSSPDEIALPDPSPNQAAIASLYRPPISR